MYERGKVDKKTFGILLIGVGVIFGGIFLMQGEKRLFGIERSVEGYQKIVQLKDVYKVYPLTEDQLQSSYQWVTETVKQELYDLVNLPLEKQNQESVIVALDKTLALLDWLGGATELVYLVSPEKEVREKGAYYNQEIQ